MKRSKEEIKKLSAIVDDRYEVSNIREDISDRLQHFMNELDWSAYSLGKVSGISDRTIRRVLDCDTDISVDNLYRLCLAMDVKIYDLFHKLGWHQPEDDN